MGCSFFVFLYIVLCNQGPDQDDDKPTRCIFYSILNKVGIYSKMHWVDAAGMRRMEVAQRMRSDF